MKILLKMVLIFTFLLCSIPNYTYATEELIQSQYESMDLSSLISAGNNYTKENFPDIDIKTMLQEAITGKVEKKGLINNIISITTQEIRQSIKIMCSILIIVIIHSILKSIIDGLENSNSGKIAYYIEYILIVTIILTDFSKIISSVSKSISDMVSYINILVPILLSLIATTGNVASASFMQPIILFIVILVGNVINVLILPISLVATVLGIVSNISDKIQISKLAGMIRKSTIWILVLIVTIFISILSLEGSLTSSVDGITIKTLQTATSNFVPIVGKTLKDSVALVLRRNICNKKCGSE